MIHQPVLLQEVLTQLAIKKDGIYIDATFGRGGHSRKILEQLSKNGILIGLDQDPEAIMAAEELQKIYGQLRVKHTSFANLAAVARELGVYGQVDGILLDLGVSSPQLDVAERGFSFNKEGPLDMRMDPTQGEPLASWLIDAEEADIIEILRRYGEERFAKRIAHAIISTRVESPLVTTTQLAKLIESAVPFQEPGKHKATRSFQAFRIFINNELQVLQECLVQCLEVLRVGGRLLTISFHSLEDRIVKQFVRQQEQGERLPSYIPVRADHFQPKLRAVGKVIKASKEEIVANVRARSATLRIAEKLA